MRAMMNSEVVEEWKVEVKLKRDKTIEKLIHRISFSDPPIEEIKSLVLKIDRDFPGLGWRALVHDPWGINYALHAAVRANRKDVVAFLVEKQGNLELKDLGNLTALMYACLKHGKLGPDMFRFLLSYGANVDEVIQNEECKQVLRNSIAMQYWSDVAKSLPRNTNPQLIKNREVMKLTELNRIHYGIVGQSLAKHILSNAISGLYGARTSKKPLVAVLAGPPGHGKTVLAQQVADAIGADHSNGFHFVECNMEKNVASLVGLGPAYRGGELGSLLDQFLTKNSQKRAVVLLDEFEKTTQEIRDVFLRLFDTGDWVNRSTYQKVDVSDILFLLTTNVASEAIKVFFDFHGGSGVLTSGHEFDSMTNYLYEVVKAVLKGKFGMPITSRINCVAPFVPLDKRELAVLCEQYIFNYVQDVSKAPVSRRPVGNVTLKISPRVFSTLANGYDEDTGARSIESEIERKIQTPLGKAFANGLLNVQDATEEARTFRVYVSRPSMGILVAQGSQVPIDDVENEPIPAATLAEGLSAPETDEVEDDLSYTLPEDF
eukprot:CAMPEP_0196654688 /NCGR_PEP_ID=MMETSP1086-20130531/4413_1 /TAXON_ID=77921 /ORGANISM="Cyanoptyche  gloeocystis , Strain SAG4.97" /LENGTH=544 /DNA_ID=CAMNT_0041986593 /DNA_START=364 /DNA_END=1998 /DNA_ORIENTATION=-